MGTYLDEALRSTMTHIYVLWNTTFSNTQDDVVLQGMMHQVMNV